MKYPIKPLLRWLPLFLLMVLGSYATTHGETQPQLHTVPDPVKKIVDGFLGPDLTICKNDTIRLEAPLATEYFWSTGSNNRFIDVHPTDTTQYWVRIKNLQNLEESDTLNVNVNLRPSVTISPLYTALLPGEAVLLTATGAATYVWDNGTIGNQLFVEPSFPENIYTVTGTSSLGCTSKATAQVDVNYTTNAAFEHTPTCFGETTFFEAKVLTNDTIQSISWDLDHDLMFDDGTGSSQQFDFENPGEYLVGIKVITKHSPEAHIKYLPVVVGDSPVVSFTYSPTCSQVPIQFLGNAFLTFGNIESWSWTFGNGLSSDIQNPVITFQQTGAVPVTLTVTTTTGCVTEVNGNFTSSPKPNLTVGLADGSQIIELPLVLFRNDTIRLRAYGNFDSLKWNQQMGNDRLTVVRPGNYTAVAYRDGCSSNPVSIGVIKSEFPFDPSLKIQNILTPNGDGFNDTWEISMLNALRPAIVSIYTRSGMLVFSTTNYQNDWKGNYENNPLPEGSYFYIIKGAEGEIYKGTITLLR
ncbi:MAG: gliding motility-associated C-terminal domain-containing protein [Bacteroidales bacterium]|nr:gliding motility-associated C-terminal domain-containing protein [Bacteroidales bacterium]